MKERPILFSGAMVRALLDGSKTQTRRIVKKQPFERPGKHDHRMGYVSGRAEKGDEIDGFYAHTTCAGGEWQAKCPYGQPGDQLWVRESGIYTELLCPDDPTQPGMFIHDVPTTTDHGHYWIQRTRAHGASYHAAGTNRESHKRGLRSKVVPSIHMPRWASRLQLEITSIRVERLNDISKEDAAAEGIERVDDNFGNGPAYRDYHMKNFMDTAEWYSSPIDSYKSLWEEINGAGSWDANPWVWVIEFKRVKP